MDFRLTHKIAAAAVFIVSFIVLFMTVQPSVSFWDCGEFIAAAYYLQVPHPPGTPFFLLIGRIFAMIPFAENIAFRVNMVSVLTSAFSVLFLYLIAVKLIIAYRGKPENTTSILTIILTSAIGALSFSFSDTFWFNGVEAEVYAFSTFLFAVVVWLMMLWYEKADSKDNEKYLLMIAYLIGLSTGVHLMSVLAIVPVAMVVLFRKYLDDEEACKKTGYIFLGHVAAILLIAIAMWSAEKGTVPPSPQEYQDYDSKFKMIVLGVSVVIMGAFWRQIFSRNSFYMPLIIGGIALFLTYPGIVKLFPTFLASIGGDDIVLELVILALIFAAIGYAIHYSVKNNKPTLNLAFMSLLFILLGFTTYAMVIIRANQNPPMNENEPDRFTELVTYLNREQYGDFPTFKRRFATEPHQSIVYENYSSDLDFFYSYQMNHMMTRYWLWNYAGREGWDQDAGANIAPFNAFGNFFGKLIAVRFDGNMRDSLFGIPLLIGLLGMYYHFRRDWKMASVFMIMFILMGYLTAFYQNQQQPQPRERDYFYVGAFFVFSIWIALGMQGMIEVIRKKIKADSMKRAATFGVLTLGIAFIPVNMLLSNYHTHDRSRNWVPWDYSYNILQSCAPNAILFTNGDNDTFPLWYLQDVEGVRRDVKVANLSLLNTPWYIKQLKNNDPYEVGTVSMRFTDAQIEGLRPIPWETQEVYVPLPKPGTQPGLGDLSQEFNVADTTLERTGGIRFTMKPTLSFGNVNAVRVQDRMVREIVESNMWDRPIYFAVTCAEDSKIGLQDHLMMEGMAFRLVPQKRVPGVEFVNVEVLSKQLQENPGYSKDYEPGFKFRGLNDPTIFFDENHRRMTQNYRNAFIRLALYYINSNQGEKGIAVLENMEQTIPRTVIPVELGLLYELSNLYFHGGAMDKYIKLAEEIEEKALQRLEENPTDASSYYNPYRILLDVYENLGNNHKLLDLWRRIQVLYPNDPGVQENVKRYENIVAGKDTVAR